MQRNYKKSSRSTDWLRSEDFVCEVVDLRSDSNSCVSDDDIEKAADDDYASNTSQLQQASGPSDCKGHVILKWHSKKTLVKERVALMFNNETLADVHFIVGSGSSRQRIPAHKFVLSIGSPVFNAMFYGPLPDTNEIEVPDVEPQAFFALLRFLYSDSVGVGPENVMTTLYTAKKYAVPDLESHCVEFLRSNITPDNAFMLLTQARLFDEPELASMCLKTIDRNTDDAMSADGFTDIDIETLRSVLKRDTLTVKEVKLFNHVLRWASEECERKGLSRTVDNQRKVLEPALKLIRFPIMAVDEYAGGPAQSGILTDKEVVSLFLYFTVNPKPAIEFVDTPRIRTSKKEYCVSRYKDVEKRWGYSGPSDRIRFIVDKPVYILGFGLYGSIYIPSEYSVTIELIHTPTDKVLACNKTTLMCDGTQNIFRVLFEEPVLIQSNNSYTASTSIKGPDSHYGRIGSRKVQVDTHIGKVTFQFSFSVGNNNGTSIEEGQIPQILFHI